MSLEILILPAIAAIVVFLFYMTVVQMVSKKESLGQRIRRMLGNAPDAISLQFASNESLHNELQPSDLAASCENVLRFIGVDVVAFREKSQLRFYRAGITSPDAPVYYLLLRYIGGPISVVLAFYIVFFMPGEGTTRLMHWLMAFLLVTIGMFGSQLFLDNQRQKRERILQYSFPDALDLLLVCVDSGLALDGALARVCKELWRARPEISQELNRTRVELTLLNDRAQALTNLAERTDLLPFRSLVATLLQSERFGTSLTETLRVLSDDYRNTRLLMAEEKAGRLPVLITLPLVAFLMPALFIMILGPGVITVMSTISKM